MRDMTFIDNQEGVSVQTAGDTDTQQIFASGMTIYGESEAEDCPSGHKCYCKDKYGFMLFGNNLGGKALHPQKQSSLPVSKIKSEGAWAAEINVESFKFKDFTSSKTRCGAKQHVFARNKHAADYVPMQQFTQTTFDNVVDDALIWIERPPAGWATIDDCGEWPCTAPENIVLVFKGTQFENQRISQAEPDFTIVSDNKGAAESYASCVSRPQWQAFQCLNSKIGMLLFESLDEDTYDRSVQPVIITNEKTGYSNKLNSMMDHVWDGFYTG